MQMQIIAINHFDHFVLAKLLLHRFQSHSHSAKKKHLIKIPTYLSYKLKFTMKYNKIGYTSHFNKLYDQIESLIT